MPSSWRRNPNRPRARGVPTRLAQQTLTRANHQCEIRGETCEHEAKEVDHIIPVAEGGTDEPTNLQAVCRSCHREKTLHEIARGKARRLARLRRPEPPHPGYV